MEQNQLKLIKKLDEFNKIFDEEIEKALYSSVFEYKIINIFIVEKDDYNYKLEKNKWPNKEIRILFHGTELNGITGILSTQFFDANIHIFGKGVYFTNLLDYAWYYAGENRRDNFKHIPAIGDQFSFVASEIYYDQQKMETVYNCNTQNEYVQKNGIRYAYVDAGSYLMSKEKLEKYDGFIGNEFLISDKNQILPLYGVTMKRVEYLVIWRDYNFNEKNPNNNSQKIFNEMKEFHNKIKKILLVELNSKVYYAKDTEEAINLIKRKKYNKIIIVTNGNNQGKEFIIEARKIIGSNVICAVSAFWVKSHINWVKQLDNVMLLNGIDLHLKFFKSVINNDINSLIQLKKEICDHYNNIPGFGFKEFSKDIFRYPKFLKQGKFQDLKFPDNNNKKDNSSCIIL